eukprot:4484887-Pyramimonas_sp.AAC.1
MGRCPSARESSHVSSQDHHHHPDHHNDECHATQVRHASVMAGWPSACVFTRVLSQDHHHDHGCHDVLVCHTDLMTHWAADSIHYGVFIQHRSQGLCKTVRLPYEPAWRETIIRAI